MQFGAAKIVRIVPIRWLLRRFLRYIAAGTNFACNVT
jgi:hypothetical protein